MHRKTITLTEQQADWVKNQVSSGHYGNDSEYIRNLVRQDQLRHQAEQELAVMVDTALASGISNETPDSIWQKILQENAVQ